MSINELQNRINELESQNTQLLSELNSPKHNETFIKDFVNGFSTYNVGDEFFDSVVEYLGKTLNVNFAFIGKIAKNNKGHQSVKTIALSAFGKSTPNIQYSLPDGPCEQVVKGSVFSYPRNCRTLFPKNKTLAQFDVEGYIGYPLFDSKGEVLGLIAVMDEKEIINVDRTEVLLKILGKRAELEIERLKYEEALEKSNEKLEKRMKEDAAKQSNELLREREIFRSFFMQAPALLCILKGPEHIFEFANPPYKEFVGNRELLGRSIRDATPEVGEIYFDKLDDVYFSGESFSGKEMLTYVDRGKGEPEECYFDFTCRAILDKKGHPEGLFLFAIPVTEKVIARKKMEENTSRIHLIAEAMPQKVWTASPDGNVDYVNQQWLDYTGISFDDLKGQGWQEIVHPEDWETNHQLWQYSIETGSDFELEHRFKRKDGKYRWHLDRGQAVKDDAGKIIMWVGTNTDINDKKRSEEKLAQAKKIAEHSLMKGNRALAELTVTKKQLEELMKVKEQFLLNMSHEIRTPMNAIVGFTGLLLKTPLDPEQKDFIEAIRISGENLLVIINDILDFSKIQAGKIQFEKISFKIRQVMSTVTELMLPRSIEKGIRLSTVIDKNIPFNLIGDPTRLNQILLNLVGNAIKFTEKGDVKVEVKLISENEKNIKLEFSVTDTGIGIPENSILSIFEEFTQATGNITRKYGGTGLGLSIVKQLVEAQRGNISVKSRIGVGTALTFTLVYGKDTDPDSGSKNKKNSAIENEDSFAVEGLNVLLVEDNVLNQRLAFKILKDWNWNVELAENGVIAVEKMKNKNFDLILMDIQLPEMDGYEATRILRTQLPESKSNTPVIALTAHAMSTEEEKCYKAGMNGYISKPFNPKKLYSMVLSILNKSGYFLGNINEGKVSWSNQKEMPDKSG